MAMNMTGEFVLPADKATVWARLNDADTLKASIPGCESLEKLSDTDFQAVVKVKIGPVSARFNGKVHLTDMDPPNSYRIAGEGGAREAHPAALRVDNGTTQVTVGGRSFAIVLASGLKDIAMHGTVDGQPFCAQVERVGLEYRIALRGTDVIRDRQRVLVTSRNGQHDAVHHRSSSAMPESVPVAVPSTVYWPGTRQEIHVQEMTRRAAEPWLKRRARNCAVFDTARQTLRYLRVPYDAATAARKVREAGLPEKLALRLEQGR